MTGKTIAHYAVGEKLGAGGMGVVYQATDTKLGREVALKVLPEGFAKDHERMARFKREAQVLASLNHPNIAAIYGLEQEGDTHALVLELVEGPTLAERIGSGRIPVDDALDVARQIAEALEAAHEQGIIHRDLKPANVKVKDDGTVKVLDFGLAKALEDPISGEDIANSPTLSVAATRAGVILGTAAYMSPEQARGAKVDKRADIWSFGVVLFEMLTGERVFDGETTSDILAAVLRAEIDWDALPSGTPAAIRKVLRRCLERDRKRRLHDIADARLEIEEALAASSSTLSAMAVTGPQQPAWKQWLPWAATGALAVAALVMGWQLARAPSASKNPVRRFTINLPDTQILFGGNPNLAFSPDGTQLVYVALDFTDSTLKLFRRPLDQLEAEAIPGTENAVAPFFSPDGKWMGFYSPIGNAKLMKVSTAGGDPIEIASQRFAGDTWGPDDTIIYAPDYNTGLWRIPTSGGEPEILTEPDKEKGELGHWWPQFLPGGRAVLYTNYTPPAKNFKVEVLDLSTGERRTLIEGGYFGRYVPTGHIVYVQGETLMAVPFDPARLEVTGSPVPVLDDVPADTVNATSQFAFSADGTLAYVPGRIFNAERELVWVDRRGEATPVTETRRRYAVPSLSPDGRRIAMRVGGENQDVWIQDLARGISTRLTFEATSESHPVWTPDGRRIIYRSDSPAFDLYWKATDGSGPAEPLYISEFDKHPLSVSPDGRTLLYAEAHPETNRDLWLLPLEGERKPEPFLRTPFTETRARFSPDGRWVAYQSDESGRNEVYVRSFQGPARRVQVSTEGGGSPVWSRDGKELFYRLDRQMLSVSVNTRAGISVGAPRVLFEGNYHIAFADDHPGYDVAADGRFLMIRTPDEELPREIHIVLNWFDEIRRLTADAN